MYNSTPENRTNTKNTFAFAEVVRVTYPGGFCIAKGEALLKRIIRENQSRHVMIAEVDVSSRAIAMDLRAALRA